MNEQKLIIYVGGGAMAGVFGAGVLYALAEQKVYDKVEAIYGVSAGAMDAAYFLSEQKEIGPSIYCEDLTHHFLYPGNLLKEIWQIFKYHFFHKLFKKKANVIDIDYVMQLVTGKKRLDIDKVFDNKPELFIQVFNLDSEKTEFIKTNKDNIFNLLRATICVAPLWWGVAQIGNSNYLDGAIKDPLVIEYLIKSYPDRKIVVILNERFHTIYNRKRKIIFWISGILTSWMHGKNLLRYYRKNVEEVRRAVEIAEKNKNVILVMPSLKDQISFSTSKENVLAEALRDGKTQGCKVLNVI